MRLVRAVCGILRMVCRLVLALGFQLGCDTHAPSRSCSPARLERKWDELQRSRDARDGGDAGALASTHPVFLREILRIVVADVEVDFG